MAKQSKNKAFRGIAKYLKIVNEKSSTDTIKIIHNYCKNILDFEGTLNECAKEIQKDFKKFKLNINQLNK